MRRPVLPSGWTCLGLVWHLALDVERFWFRAVVAGEKMELESGDVAWQVPPEAFMSLPRPHATPAISMLCMSSSMAGPGSR